MLKKVDFKRLLVSFLVVAAIVLVQLIVTKGTYGFYDELIKPELAPKAIVFPIVWTIIYFILAISLYFVYDNKKIVIATITNLIINIIWPILFFKFELLLISIYWLLLLIISLIYLLILFYRKSTKLCYANLPYLVWCFFALYLNIMFYLINK